MNVGVLVRPEVRGQRSDLLLVLRLLAELDLALGLEVGVLQVLALEVALQTRVEGVHHLTLLMLSV